ncbi:hypothetical protein ACS3SW_07825 [Roseobacteraceae bacterium S113]
MSRQPILRTGPSITLTSAARYLAIGVAMIPDIWVLGSKASIITPLAAWLVMDMLDLVAGLQIGLIAGPGGIARSFAMFLGPNFFAMAGVCGLTRTAQTND